MYNRSVLVGGLDVSLFELQPLANGTEPGSGRLQYTPDRAIFSFLFKARCAEGSMSDWLDVWPVGETANYRLADIADDLRATYDCTPGIPPGGKP